MPDQYFQAQPVTPAYHRKFEKSKTIYQNKSKIEYEINYQSSP